MVGRWPAGRPATENERDDDVDRPHTKASVADPPDSCIRVQDVDSDLNPFMVDRGDATLK